MKRLLTLLLVVAATTASAQTPTPSQTFWLRNTDIEAVFYWWALPVAVGPVETVLPRLPLAPLRASSIAAAPGERVKVTLEPGQTLVGVFVPWGGNLSFRTVVSGGFLLASEALAKGTLLVTERASSFAAANRGRASFLRGAVAGVGAGRVPSSCSTANPTTGPRCFRRSSGDRSSGPTRGRGPLVPRPARVLQVAADAEGALWIHLTSDQPWPAGTSLMLSRPPVDCILGMAAVGRHRLVVDGQ